jgi:hypothetical protein
VVISLAGRNLCRRKREQPYCCTIPTDEGFLAASTRLPRGEPYDQSQLLPILWSGRDLVRQILRRLRQAAARGSGLGAATTADAAAATAAAAAGARRCPARPGALPLLRFHAGPGRQERLEMDHRNDRKRQDRFHLLAVRQEVRSGLGALHSKSKKRIRRGMIGETATEPLTPWSFRPAFRSLSFFSRIPNP